MRYLFTLLLLTVSALAQPLTSHDPAFLQSTSPLRRGLVGYWSLEEATGTRYDRSPSGNHLTANNSPGSPAVQGAAATFVAASSQWLSKSDNASFPTNSVTVACWVKFTTWPANGNYPALISKWGAVTNRQYSLSADGDADKFAFSVATNTLGGAHTVYATTFGLPPTGSWIFVVGWYDSSSATVNINVNNGTTDTSASVNPIASSIADLEIGRLLTWYLNANIDELGIWNRVLTADEITRLYSAGRGATYPSTAIPTTGLVSYWKLDEASGTRYDAVGTNHLTDNNSVDQAAGKVANCATFVAASSQFLSIPSNASLQLGNTNWTVAGWVKPTANAEYFLVGKMAGSTGYGDFQIYRTLNTRLIYVDVRSNTTIRASVTSTNVVPTNTWTHFCARHNASTPSLEIFINGALDNSAINYTNGAPIVSTNSFTIGRYSDANSPFTGSLDEISFHKRLLTTNEITFLYNSGRGRRFPFVNSP